MGRCWLNPNLGPILPSSVQPKTSDFYGAEVALISLGILTICRVFGLGLGGAFGGFIPFGGLLVLIAVMLAAHRAYRDLNVLRLTLPIVILFHLYMLYLSWTTANPTISQLLFVFTLFLSALGLTIY